MINIIEFVECDNCQEDGIINNKVYETNKNNLDNLKCWNCKDTYVLDIDYLNKLFK
jgi:hypothetical protein